MLSSLLFFLFYTPFLPYRYLSCLFAAPVKQVFYGAKIRRFRLSRRKMHAEMASMVAQIGFKSLTTLYKYVIMNIIPSPKCFGKINIVPLRISASEKRIRNNYETETFSYRIIDMSVDNTHYPRSVDRACKRIADKGGLFCVPWISYARRKRKARRLRL